MQEPRRMEREAIALGKTTKIEEAAGIQINYGKLWIDQIIIIFPRTSPGSIGKEAGLLKGWVPTALRNPPQKVKLLLCVHKLDGSLEEDMLAIGYYVPNGINGGNCMFWTKYYRPIYGTVYAWMPAPTMMEYPGEKEEPQL